MTSEERLGDIVSSLESVGIWPLVMGGHAVRFYGLARNTNDFDLHVAPEVWNDLSERMKSSPFFSQAIICEGPTWRSGAFRRFQIGYLSDGGEEWLEFWRHNHLLGPHENLAASATRGAYGKRELTFLGLADLVRSKETEREKDWNDVKHLEERLDVSRIATGSLREAMKGLRSRHGFGEMMLRNLFADRAAIASAFADSTNPVTQAYLLPFVNDLDPPEYSAMAMEPLVVSRLRSSEPGSSIHLALVEIVRRRYIEFRREQDRKDKQAALKAP